MSNTQPMVYLLEGHVTGHTVPIHPNVLDRWKRGELTRVNEDGSTWPGDPFAMPGEPGSRIDTPPEPDDDGPEPVKPRGNASRIEWAGYAVSLGAASEEDAGVMTRDELIELTTPAEDRPLVPA
jgi:hypothetical protein